MNKRHIMSYHCCDMGHVIIISYHSRTRSTKRLFIAKHIAKLESIAKTRSTH